MTLIDSDILAVSSSNNINIYSFDKIINKSFDIIKILKGHNDSICDIKMMNNSKNLLLSCSCDKDCRLWDISQEYCLRIFRGHSNRVNSLLILSEKIFASASAEIIFWHIDNPGIIHCIKPDQSGSRIATLLKTNESELVFAGMHNFIGWIR